MVKFLNNILLKLKVPFDEAETLKSLTQKESLDNSWGDNLFGIIAQIIATNDLAKLYKGKFDDSTQIKVFKRSKLNFIFVVLVGIFIVSVFGSILINHSVVIIGTLTQLFNKETNFNLILTKEGITIKDIYYP